LTTDGAWSAIVIGGTTAGTVRYPSGIAVDDNDELYISDYDPTGYGEAGRVQKFTSTGEFQAVLGGEAMAAGGLNQNMGLSITADKQLFVADTLDSEILSRNANGDWLTIVGTGILNGPRDVVVDSWGNVIIADTGNNRVLMLPVTTSTPVNTTWDAGYTDLGGGWRRLSWFGDYIPMGGQGWIWHNKHGFFYVPPSSTPESIFFYAQDMGWLWTSSTTYPYLYRFCDGAWLWYNGATNPRWFLNMSTVQWESW